jgi:hypothetical protein
MKLKYCIACLGLAAAGAITFSGAALAQNVLAQFVVSGKDAENTFEQRRRQIGRDGFL